MHGQDSQSIMLVEDDCRLATLIAEFLQDEGYNVTVLGRGDDAIDAIAKLNPDLVVLDLMLPGASGFDVCRAVRQQFRGLIMMLTARDDDIDQIVGLELGADDYVTKPIEPRVLLARIRSLLRRSVTASVDTRSGAQQPTVVHGNLTVQIDSREVLLEGQSVPLTTMEFDLLTLLATQPGCVLSRDTLFRELRGLPFDGLDRSVDVCIARLRKKLGDTNNPARRIKTVRGKGYLFAADAWQ